MKKRILAVLMAAIMAVSFTACGGGDKNTANSNAGNEQNEVTVDGAEFTPEQVALAEEYLEMIDAYNAVVDKVNASEELLAQQELVDVMNEITVAIEEADECFEDPACLTDEVMAELRKAFDETYKFIDQVNALADDAGTGASGDLSLEQLADIFTIAYFGVVGEEAVYYFMCDEDVISGGLAVMTIEGNMMCIGDITKNSDGSRTLVDVSGEYQTTFTTEEIPSGIRMNFEGGSSVDMYPCTTDDVITAMLTIEAESLGMDEH